MLPLIFVAGGLMGVRLDHSAGAAQRPSAGFFSPVRSPEGRGRDRFVSACASHRRKMRTIAYARAQGAGPQSAASAS
jgi:hypothetical protein